MMNEKVIEILRGIENPVVFELGACDAKYTQCLFFACEKGDPDYYAFEPDPRNIKLCLDRMPPAVHFVPAAIGNVTGKVPFYLAAPQLHDGVAGSSSISPFKDLTTAFKWCTHEGTIEVDCYRLDDFCYEHNVSYIDLIFMDIQGAERLMIEGAQYMLKNTRWLWTEFEGVQNAGTLYEHSSSLKQIKEMLPDWAVVEIDNGDALLVNTKFNIETVRLQD